MFDKFRITFRAADLDGSLSFRHADFLFAVRAAEIRIVFIPVCPGAAAEETEKFVFDLHVLVILRKAL